MEGRRKTTEWTSDMQYRKFGKLDWQVSALGFGCMRLPTTGAHADIDEAEATRMLHFAIDHGVNYIDTAYPYHGGNSERLVGKALCEGNYRQKVRLATKLPCWHVETASDFDRYLNEQLTKLQTDHIDFYLLHALNQNTWNKMCDLDIFPKAEQAIADGRIGHLGFSFHDSYEIFQEIVDGYEGWTFCQIQYNYMDIEERAGTRGLKYAASKDLAVVIMEPIRGGRLVNPPPSIQSIWDTAKQKRSPADWALQWVWNHPEVSLALSGMSAMIHVEENLASADASAVHSLNEEDLKLIGKVREKYRQLCPIPCTRCEYCMPCPNGVIIPQVFEVYNDGGMYDKPDWARDVYNHWVKAEERADNCIACQECEELCPQKIPISQWMPVVHGTLTENKPFVTSLQEMTGAR
jgi:predicted aldo/keto reductase-like oxidoreductase